MRNDPVSDAGFSVPKCMGMRPDDRRTVGPCLKNHFGAGRSLRLSRPLGESCGTRLGGDAPPYLFRQALGISPPDNEHVFDDKFGSGFAGLGN